MKKLVPIVLIVAIALVMLVGGCPEATPTPTTPAPTTPAPTTPAPTTPAPPQTLDIGIACALTGPTAFLGENIKNAALMAIDDQNAEGGITIGGQQYTINAIIRDTKNDIGIGKTVAEELVYDEEVPVICGLLVDDCLGALPVTEPNKVLNIATGLFMPEQSGPDKPYSFYPAGTSDMYYINGAAFIKEFYPEAKSVIGVGVATPDLPGWVHGCETIYTSYGFEYLGYEEYPVTTTDFTAVVTRLLDKEPDIINTLQTGGTMGPLCGLLIKQLREGGFDGIICLPSVPPPDVIMGAVPAEYLTKCVTNDIDIESPVVSDEYHELSIRYFETYGTYSIDIAWEVYNGVKPFFESIDGLDTMDTTAWMEAYAAYRWDGVWGYESFWIGKPMFGIDRTLFRGFWVSEYTDGQLETKWEAPIPYELYVEE